MGKRGYCKSGYCKLGCYKFSLINLVLVVGLLVVGYVGYTCYLNLNKKTEGLENKKELVLVHMTGCGHCKTLMPDWESASKENKTGINMRSVEMSEKDGPDLCKKHNITGFPTMLLLENGKKIKDYDGERNKNSILQFLQNN